MASDSSDFGDNHSQNKNDQNINFTPNVRDVRECRDNITDTQSRVKAGTTTVSVTITLLF